MKQLHKVVSNLINESSLKQRSLKSNWNIQRLLQRVHHHHTSIISNSSKVKAEEPLVYNNLEKRIIRRICDFNFSTRKPSLQHGLVFAEVGFTLTR